MKGNNADALASLPFSTSSRFSSVIHIMTTYFVSRHPGALEWMRKNRIPFDDHVAHLDIERIHPDDTVIGSLPVNLAAEVCARGARYRHLALKLAAADRGRELSAKELEDHEVCLEPYLVTRSQ
jgi:CRISPR-associated protein Csx16